jgi:hypothetical protein
MVMMVEQEGVWPSSLSVNDKSLISYNSDPHFDLHFSGCIT